MTLLLALPLQAETLLERLRAQLREAAAERDSPVLQRLDQAATDVHSIAARVERHVDASVGFLREIAPCGTAPSTPPTPPSAPHEELSKIPEELDSAFEELVASRDAAKALLTPQSPPRFADALRRAIETTDDMLARRRESSVAANWLRRFSEERRRSTTHQDLCRLLDSVAPLSEPFTLAELRRDPLVPLRRVDEAVRRQVHRRHNALQRGEWSLGLGAQWTPMRVDGETRAGQPIALLGFRPLPEDLPILRDAAIRPWVQIGTGLEFDEPSFYVGGAVDLGPYALLGVGWTAQDTGEEFDGDVFVSMTVRLERVRRWFSE
ncbi:MAG TPA: hypothetical protein VHK90_13650 [Thermoanaerobaculia bacterium]|nr:hypothetical protein [Thermoanaerobaculia bacterium]